MLNTIIYYIKLIQAAGIKNALHIYLNKKKNGKLLTIKVKKFPNTIYLRSNTSDIQTFTDLIIGTHNHISRIQLDNAKVIIDAGANIGITTIICANAFPSARIFALEPEETNFEMLKKNTERYSNITIVKKALWYKRELLEIANKDATHWAFNMKKADNETGSVEAVTIDDLFEVAMCSCIDYIKIDVEGAEKEIFDTVQLDTLKKIKIIGIELHDRVKAGCSKSFYSKMTQLEYDEIRNFSGDHILKLNSDYTK